MSELFSEKFTEVPIEKDFLEKIRYTYGECFTFGIAISGRNYYIVEDRCNDLTKWHVYDRLMFNYLIVSGQTYFDREGNYYLQDILFPVGNNTDLQNALMSIVFAIVLDRLHNGSLGNKFNAVESFRMGEKSRIREVLKGINYRVGDDRIIHYEL
jgi:hypothetical protein